eukprot:TRINITY_DN29_c4_g1_i1.p1 TRINITY_DN29_c4_g1~~TRINITY_DN29_c4_g1_i1.p1  ORF type:complete len:669 (+),score=383.71 TRINITY_DN29_c4_g1_i1:107-2113(+)
MDSRETAQRRLQILESHLINNFNDKNQQYYHHSNHQNSNSNINNNFDKSECCGIVGYVGRVGETAANYLIEGLKVLESRGYDSAGVSTIDQNNNLFTTKFASSQSTSDAISRVASKIATGVHNSHSIGIAHTRWATHGAKTDQNAHPHHDQWDRIALAHNGVIENSHHLRTELKQKGVNFSSETDTEVIAQLIGYELHNDSQLSFLDAVKKTLSRLEGTWGLAIIDKQTPDQIIAAKNGSPLLIGISTDRMFVASESSAFSQHTKEFIALEDGEVAVVKANEHSLDRSRIELAVVEQIAANPAPFPHWTIKEMMDQPEAISRSLNFGGRLRDEISVKLGGLDDKRDTLLKIDNLILVGCGTSWHACLYGALLMRWLNCFLTAQAIDAAEVGRDSIPKSGAGLLALSQSGETKDVSRVVSIAEEVDIPTFSVVNVVRSLIARQTSCGVYLNAGREVAVASTKAFTCQVTVLALVSIWFAQERRTELQRRRQLIEALHRLPTNVGMTLHKVRGKCQQIAQKMLKTRSCFILGKGFAEPIAREGALKIKEITYVHAEGFPGGALKHGPFALIEPGVPIFLIVLNDQHEASMKTAAAEVKARGAFTIIITNLLDKDIANQPYFDEVISIPSCGPLTALLATIPLQMIAYELAILRGIDPDRPRNLAKSVTVD